MTEPFRFSNGQIAYNVQDLIGVCQQSPQEGIDYLKRGDFENWLAYIGEGELSKKVQEIRHTSLSDEEKLKQFVTSLQPPKPKKPIAPRTKAEKAVASEEASNEIVNPIAKVLQTIKSLLTGN